MYFGQYVKATHTHTHTHNKGSFAVRSMQVRCAAGNRGVYHWRLPHYITRDVKQNEQIYIFSVQAFHAW